MEGDPARPVVQAMSGESDRVSPTHVTLPRAELTQTERLTLIGLALVGAVTAAIGAPQAAQRFWASWLLVGYFALGVGLSGLCFVAIHYTTGASWSVVIRRIAEAFAEAIPLAVILIAVVFVAGPQLYPWTNGVGSAADAALAFKRFWLSWPFFLARASVYAAIWIGFALEIGRRSRRQDQDGDPRWTRANAGASAAFLVTFGVTFTFASIDWVMSLDPFWYSTIFAVYNFAGLFASGLSALILVALWLERRGPLQQMLNEDHLHDLGKLLFAFSTFWMYIWFSQYMLIWYTNIPEETSYFVRRVHGPWAALFMANILLNWVLPFAMLLRRDSKRRRATLGLAATAVLVGRWVDIYLMIFPTVVGQVPRIGVWEIGLTAGGLGCFGLVLAWILRAAPIVPVGDPQLAESLGYEQ
jgi:Ni/Fe-hydrogenase subunit HybB-like protein